MVKKSLVYSVFLSLVCLMASCKSDLDINDEKSIQKQRIRVQPQLEENTVLIQHKKGFSIGVLIPGKIIVSCGKLAVDGDLVTVYNKDKKAFKAVCLGLVNDKFLLKLISNFDNQSKMSISQNDAQEKIFLSIKIEQDHLSEVQLVKSLSHHSDAAIFDIRGGLYGFYSEATKRIIPVSEFRQDWQKLIGN